MIHQIKILPEHLDAVVDEVKTFELRKDDRNYSVGDTLVLSEGIEEAKQYTGRQHSVTVTNILRNQTGLYQGYCIISIEAEDKEKS